MVSRADDVTVAIPTMDRPRQLGRCLDALLAGDRPPGRIVVVDQSKSDASRLAVSERTGPVCEIVHVHETRRNASAARNIALRRVESPVVAFTDDDCVPAPGWVAAFGGLESDPTLVAMTGPVLPYGPERSGLHAVSSRTSVVEQTFERGVAPWLVGTGGNLAVRCAWLTRVGGFDERLGPGSPGRAGEDMDVLHRLLRDGARIRYDPRALVYHERQDARRRGASRWNYGVGLGACCGVWLREGDQSARRVMREWLWLRLGLMRRSVAERRGQGIRDELRVLLGTLAGLTYGLRIGGRAVLR